MKCVLYSTITGGYDDVHPLKKSSWDSYLFTDESLPGGKGWKIKDLGDHNLNPRRVSKWFKINSHVLFPDADYIIWIDGRLELLVDPDDILKYLKDGDIACFNHPDRDCIYDEAEEIIRLDLDHKAVVERQMKFLQNENYPSNMGLNAGGVIVRRNNLRVTEFNKLWWQVLKKHSHRDQLSLNYCAWKVGLKISTIPGHYKFSNELIRTHQHRRGSV